MPYTMKRIEISWSETCFKKLAKAREDEVMLLKRPTSDNRCPNPMPALKGAKSLRCASKHVRSARAFSGWAESLGVPTELIE